MFANCHRLEITDTRVQHVVRRVASIVSVAHGSVQEVHPIIPAPAHQLTSKHEHIIILLVLRIVSDENYVAGLACPVRTVLDPAALVEEHGQHLV